MSVPEQTPYREHTGNGVAKSFALGFICESKDHLIVLMDEIEPPIATWSLSGGNVVFTTAPAAGQKITLQRNTPFGRTTDYQSYNNSFRPHSVNGDFDRVWLKLQELGVADWLMKLYVDRLHQQQEQEINDLKDYVDDRDDELRAYLMEEIRKQGVALDQLDDYYNYLMQRLAQIAVDKGWDASFVVDGNENQHEINNKTIRTVESISDLANLKAWDGRTVEVKSYYAPNFALAKPYRGTANYVYVASRSGENDGFSCINGWVQLIEDTLTFDACGVYVDDSTKRDFNTTLITALLTYAIENKKSVEAGTGRYYANTISLDRVNFDSTAFNLAGQGRKNTVFDFAIELVSSSTTTGSAYSLRWQHVKFNGFYLNPTTSVSAALTLQRVGMIYGDDVDISYSGTGFKLRGGSEVFFKNCDIYLCFRGLDLHSATDGVNGGIEIDFAVISFDNCNISNCTKHEIHKARSLYFNGGNFNANQSDSAYFYDSQLISFANISIESSKNFVFTNCSNIQLDKALMGLVASDKFVLINSTVTDNASVWEGGTGQIKLDATSQYISKSIAIYYPTFNVAHTNANLSNITFDFLPQNSMLLSNSIFTRKSLYPITMNSANYSFSNSNANYLKTGTYYIECTGGVVMLIPINSDFAGFEIIGKQIPVPELHTGSASLGSILSRGSFSVVQSLGDLGRYIYVPSPSFKNLITVGGQLYIAFSLFNGSVIDSIKVFTSSKAYSNLINRVANTSTVTIAASSKTVVTYTVSGAILGDRVAVSVNQNLTNVSVRGWVSAADVVSVEFSNLTTSPITLTGIRVSVDIS